MFWDGTEQPSIKAFSIGMWEAFHPTWTVRVLNSTTTHEYGFPWNTTSSVDLGIAGKTDFLRMTMLFQHGGIWADVDCVPVGNVEQQHMPLLQRYGYVVPEANSSDVHYKDRQIMSWFLMARKGNPMVGQWLDHADEYLFRPRAVPLTQMAEDQEDANGNSYSMTQAFGNASVAAVLGVDVSDVGPEITARAALDELERRDRWPYFWAFYLFTQTMSDAPELNATWVEARSDSATWLETRVVTKLNRRYECWKLVASPLEQMLADYTRGNWTAERAGRVLRKEVEGPHVKCVRAAKNISGPTDSLSVYDDF